MSESLDQPDAKAQAKADARADAQAAEIAAVRRRWVTLGEVLAVVAVVISGLTLWNNWSERSDSEAVKQADAQEASARAATLVLVATGSGERQLVLKPASEEQSVQSQTVRFPTALGVAPAETTGEPRIEAAWFEGPLKKARNAARLPDDSRGDERLPVVVTTRFLVDGRGHEDIALYDIGYSISGRWLAGHSVALRGVSLVSRASSAGAQAKLDARWKTLFARKQ
ncbi:hypothetical protein [Novosphingobium sp. AP12]|uniref:hypothetical protein n=1 Tax=Novosphingobium sp. AP12 TaxID=1144305 RepID=UPI0002720F6B|nr:hypothetical protein [Novosphingobium sp. AP12]EJL34989.1 hypothetical protein PMI02_00363 [Novosphingobium sp. AP12]